MSRFFIIVGVTFIVLGLLWGVISKIPFLGRLPGDIFLQKKNFTLYFPITTSILISLFLSLVLWILSRR